LNVSDCKELQKKLETIAQEKGEASVARGTGLKAHLL